MNTEKHIMYPVSYVDDDGIQQNTLYSFNPSRVAPEKYWVGEAITITTSHPDDMADSLRAAKIMELRETLEALESGKSQ
tara:strand:+ start:433 stop:669 length:237 start_codon:yes stop_codon:yes gene_type:complete